MIAELAGPDTYPFFISFLVLVGLVLVEAVTMLLGVSVSGWIDGGIDHPDIGDHDIQTGLLAGWMSWLNAGGVPLLILMMIWLASFSVAGFAIQAVCRGIITSLPVMAASAAAFFCATPMTRTVSRIVGRIIPREESSVLRQEELVGLTGTVTLGPLDQGKPGLVRVVDQHGNVHVLRTRAAGSHLLQQGATALIVDGADGLFEAIPAPEELVSGKHL